MDKAAVADFLDDYADNLSVPVRTGMSVESAVPWGRGYRLRVNDEDWTCRAIVDASGACARGKLPAISAQLPNGLAQMHAADYRNPAQLCEGGVLVVGASATGLQIAEELQTHGHPVTLAVGEHVRMPRTYRGQDVYWWLDRSGVLHETIDDVDDIRRARRVPSPQLIGRAGCNMDLNRLQDAGVEIVGRLAGLNGSQAQFSGGLANHCKSADLKLGRLLDRFDESSAAGLTAQPPHRPEATRVPASRLGMDLASGEIATVFWATGFQPEHGWLELPVFDRKGHLMHDAGVVTQAPGVYTLGHTFLRSRKSSFMFGVEDDVKHITAYLQQHLDNTADAGLRANVI
jgi:putative flavoprotein involved in K+ transport